MLRKTVAFLLIKVFAGIFIISHLDAQVIQTPESEYMRIRAMAHEGELQEAEAAAEKLVAAHAHYGDAMILLARIYAWQNKFAPALSLLDSVLVNEPDNSDAIEARNDVTRWQKGYEDSLQLKARQSAVPGIPLREKQTELRANYYFDTFDEPYSRFWQLAGLGAGHQFRKVKVIGGITIGNIHMAVTPEVRQTEVQFEAEAYPEFSKKDYGWFYYAFSPGDFFPRHRAAAEMWHSLSRGWVVSAGINYYYFYRNIFIADASVEKYIGRYWLSSKGYFYFKDDGITTSVYLNARRYFSDIDYLQLTLGTGTAPDEPFDIRMNLERLSAVVGKITYYKAVTKNVQIKAGFGYSWEEHAEDDYRSRYEGIAGLVFLLKNDK